MSAVADFALGSFFFAHLGIVSVFRQGAGWVFL